MRVWDGCSKAGITFSSEDNAYYMDRPLNYIVENDVTVKAINEVIRSQANVGVRYSTKVKKYNLPALIEKDVFPEKNVVVERTEHSEHYVHTASDRGSLKSLVLFTFGCDHPCLWPGRSLVRRSIASDYLTWEYQQMGLVASLEVETHTGENVTAWQVILASDWLIQIT